MTVAQLIAKLEKMPKSMRVVIVYDSAVCNEDIAIVSEWMPNAYNDDNKKAVGLFEKSSADDFSGDADDRRRP